MKSSRRQLLRGLGASIVLPVFETTLPKKAQAAPVNKRWGIFYIPNGVPGKDWQATETPMGLPNPPAFFGPGLKALASDLLWINGVNNPRTTGGHETIGAGFLTHVRIFGATVNTGKSVDQVVADAIGKEYPQSSLQVTAGGFQIGGNCCRHHEASLNNISYRTTPTAKIQDPGVVFGKIVPIDRGPAGIEAAKKRQALRKSVLDHVGAQTRRLQTELGKSDQMRMNDYLESVREVERKMVMQGAAPVAGCTKPASMPTANLGFEEHMRLMMDAVFLSFQCNLTPMLTYMLDFEFSFRKIPAPGVTSGHHPVSHHGGSPGAIAQLRLIHAWYGEKFAALVARMKTARDVDGKTLLENSVLSLSPGMGDGNAHSGMDIPLIVAGGGQGRLRTGRVFAGRRQLADYHRTILRVMGANTPESESFGDGTGPIAELLV